MKALHRNEMTAEDWAEYMAEYNGLKRSEAIALLGGKCQLCGSVEGLEFAHLEYRERKSRYRGQPYMEALKHPDRFLLLCHGCHKHPEKYLKELVERRADALLEQYVNAGLVTGGR